MGKYINYILRMQGSFVVVFKKEVPHVILAHCEISFALNS